MKPRPSFILGLLLAACLACSALSVLPNQPGPQATATQADRPLPSRTPNAATAATATDPAIRTAALARATPAPTGTALVTAATDVTATAAATAAATSGSASMPFTLDTAADAQAAMLPQFAGDVTTLPDASRYVIDVTVTFDAVGTAARSATLAGRELIRYTNTYSQPLDSLMLMLWPNDSDQYLGALTLGAVSVGGAPVQPVMESRGLAARLPLAAPLAPGHRVDLSVDFSARANAGAEHGARFGLTHGVLLAPTFNPIIPRLVDGQWQSDWPPSAGDVSNSDTAFYAWRITAPAGLAIAASGVVVNQSQSGDTQTQTRLTGPMRDIALAVGDLRQTQRTLPDGVRLNAWVLPEHAAQAQELLDQGAGQMQNLENLVGPYPFAELNIVDTPGTYGGVEYPGLVYIGVVDPQGGFEEATVHEVGHQWFYSLIGDDQLLEPWLDEAAASYTEALYAEKVHGADAAQRALSAFQDEADSASDHRLPIGLPVGAYASENDYVAIVYGKGALFFDALRQHLGDATFFQFLHDYYRQYKYGFATSLGFEHTAEVTCGCDLKPLFQQWVFGNQ